MSLSVEEKEVLKQKRIENLRKGREDARARRAANGSGKQVESATESEIKPVIPFEDIKPVKQESAKREKIARSWLKLGGGGALLAIGILLIGVGNMSKNAVIIAVGATLAAAGGYICYQGWQQYDVSYGARKGGSKGKLKLRNANAMKITPTSVEFVELPEDKLTDIPQRCRNDGKDYHLFFHGMDNGNLTPFVLPDPDPKERYFSPAEALNCLRMELARKYFNYQVSPTAVVSMIVIGVIIGIELITLIAMGG